MDFLLMITGTEDWMQLPQEENQRVLQEHKALEDELRRLGKYKGGGGLMPSATAKTVRNTGKGKLTVSDGPYAESKEVMGGFYLVECDSHEEAIEWAKRIPSSVPNAIEVRQMFHS